MDAAATGRSSKSANLERQRTPSCSANRARTDSAGIGGADSCNRVSVARYGPGSKIPLEYFRKGKTETVEVTIAEQPISMARGPGAPGASPEKMDDKKTELLRKLGLETVQEFTAELARRMPNTEFTPGVLVTQVRPGSEAESQGISRGTVIIEVQDKAVKTPDELAAELAKIDAKKSARLTIIAGGVQHFVVLEIPKD